MVTVTGGAVAAGSTLFLCARCRGSGSMIVTRGLIKGRRFVAGTAAFVSHVRLMLTMIAVLLLLVVGFVMVVRCLARKLLVRTAMTVA